MSCHAFASNACCAIKATWATGNSVRETLLSKGGRKTKQERREAPMFQTVVEMHSHKEWHVYTDVARHVDALLAGKSAPVQLRRHLHGKMLLSIHEVSCEAPRLKRNRGNDTWIDDLLHATQAMLASQ